MALIRDYFTKTKELISRYGPKSLILMQVGSFFEVYAYRNLHTGDITDSCLEEFVRICDFAEPSVKHSKFQPKNTETLMSGFPEYMIEKYASRMQTHGYTCAIYRQDSNTKNTTRSLDIICSPGTHFETDQSTLSNHIMCIWAYNRPTSTYNPTQQIIFGMSTIDVLNGSCNYNEISETYTSTPSCFDEVERYYSIYQPNEILFVYDSSKLETSFLEQILQSIQITSKTIHYVDLQKSDSLFLSTQATKCSKQSYQNELLNLFYASTYELSLETIKETCGFNKHYIGCQSFCFLVDFVYSHNPTLLNHIKMPVQEIATSRLHLANHSLMQLNILPTSQQSGKLSSIVSFITNAQTPMGKRAMKEAIVHPTTNTEWLQNEYSIMEHILEHYESYEWLSKSLRVIHDIPHYYRKIVMKSCKPSDMYTIYKDLYQVSILCSMLKNDTTLSKYANISTISGYSDKLIHTIDTTLDVETCKQYNSFNDMTDNIFQTGVHPSIDELHSKYATNCDQIAAIQQFISNIIVNDAKQKAKPGKKPRSIQSPCKLHHTEKTGSYFKMSSTRCKTLSTCIEKMIKTQDSPKKNTSTVVASIPITYKCSMTQEENVFTLDVPFSFSASTGSDKRIHNKQIDELLRMNLVYKTEIQTQSREKFNQFINELAEYGEYFYTISESVAGIDVIYNKTKHAKEHNYCKPEIDPDATNETAFIDATQMRHALIEQFQGDELYVPNDVVLGIKCDTKKQHTKEDALATQESILLFGTNAVGKSSLIKSIGICVIMAQAGFFVPCASFRYYPFKQLFTRILGNDNIFKGLSTFAVEMSELNTILRYSTENSIVLGDELCSGTEMGSATSIFCAYIILGVMCYNIPLYYDFVRVVRHIYHRLSWCHHHLFQYLILL